MTLDERALIEAEDEELKKLPKLARLLFQKYVSPMKDAVKDHTAAGWSPLLNTPIYGLALVVILSCALYVFLFTIQINKCGGCERHNDMFHDPATKLPRWANTTWAIDENLCRKPPDADLPFAPCDPDLCLEEQQRCLALPKRKRGDVPCPVSCPVAPETCPHTLAHYCGPSGGNKGSMAWLEAALLSIVLALFISNTISIFMSKGVVPMLARAVLNKQAGPSATFEEERKAEEDLQDADAAYMATFQPDVKEPPTPKRTALQMLIDRVDARARKIRVELAEEAARRDPIIDDVIEVTPSKREVSSEEDEPVYTPGRGAKARANRRRLRLEAEARKRALEEELARLPPGTDPWVKIAPLGLGNLRLNLAPAAQAAEAWPRPDAYSASRVSGGVWSARGRQGALRLPATTCATTARRSAKPRGAAGKWLAAHDPAESDDVVVECAAAGEVSPGAALCALAVSRRDGPDAAHKKLEQLDYRDEMELAAEVTGADDLLERWRSGRPLRRRVKRSRTTRRLLSPTGDDVQKPRAELPPVRGGRVQPL